MYTQDPTTVVTMPLNITDTSKYYYLDVIFPGTQATVGLSNVSTFVSLKPVGSYVSPSTNPWSQQGTSVTYSGGAVGIGGVNPSALTETFTVNGNTAFVGNVTVTSDASGDAYVLADRIPAGSRDVTQYVTGSVPLTTTTNLIQNYLSNAATITANTSTGTITQALSLPGTVGSGVNFQSAGSSVALIPTNTTNVFIEAWINPGVTTTGVIAAVGTSSQLWNFFLTAGSFLSFNAGGGGGQTASSLALSAGTWYHVAVSLTPLLATKANIWVNGTQTTYSSTATGLPASLASANVYIGQNFAGFNFTGNVADVRIWSGGIIPTTATRPSGFTATAAPFGTSQPAYITGTPTLQMSLQSQYFPGASTSPYGPCLTLPGTINSYYSVTNSVFDTNWKTNGFCLEAWVNYASLANSNGLTTYNFSWGGIGHMQPAGSGADWSFGPATNGQMVFYMTGASLETSNTINTGTWNHVMVQSNGSNVYTAINGTFTNLTARGYSPAGSGTIAPVGSTGFATAGYPLSVGQWNNTQGPNFAIAKARLVFGTSGSPSLGNVYSAGNFTVNPNFAPVPAGASVAWSLESQYPLPTYPSFFDVPVLPQQTPAYGAEPVVVGGVTSNVVGPFGSSYPQLDSVRFDGTGYIDYGNSASSVLCSNLWASPWTIEGWVYPTTYTNSFILNKTPDVTFGMDSRGRLNLNNIITDSVVQGALTLTGLGTDSGRSITTDSSGNFYVTGIYNSSGTVPINNLSLSAPGTQTASGYFLPASLGNDMFILKYNSSGVVQGALTLAGLGTDAGLSITTDSSGNFYVTGDYFSSLTVPINNLSLSASGTQSASGYLLPVPADADMFILKYNSSGVVQGALTIGGAGTASGRSITTDSSGNFYVTGNYANTGTRPINNLSLSASGTQSASGYLLPASLGNDMFILKYNSSGVVQGALTLAGTGTESGRSITTDSSGNFYVTGNYATSGTRPINNLSLSASGTQSASGYFLPASVAADMFILKYNSSGVVQGALTLAGTGSERAYSITTDSSGNFYVTGDYNSSGTVPINNLSLSASGTQSASGYRLPASVGSEMFILKYNSSGVVQGALTLGGLTAEYAYSITTDSSGNFYVTGNYTSSGTAVTINNLSLSASGTQSASGYLLYTGVATTTMFILKYNSSGVVQGALTLPGAGGDFGRSITTDSSGNFYVTGNYATSGTVPINNLSLSASGTQSASGYLLPASLGNDMFIFKYSFTQLPLNTWSHVAMVYDGAITNVYVSSRLTTSVVLPTLNYSPTASTQIGNNWPGNLADLRVSNVARYTGSSYTVPSEPFVTDRNTLLLLKSLGGQVGTTLEVQGRGLNAVSLGATQTVRAYPPAPMSSYLLDTTSNALVTYGQGKYVASASSDLSFGVAFHAFDKISSTNSSWISAPNYSTTSPFGYNGSVVTVDTIGNSYAGDWLQLNMPISIILNSYTIYPSDAGTIAAGQSPSKFWVLGSRDGFNWTLVDSRTGVTSWVAFTPITFTTSTTQAYTYYRLVGNQMTTGCNGFFRINELALNGTEEGICVTNDSKVGVGIANPQRALEVAGDLVVSGTISGGAGMGAFRNRIINGDMRIAQRGTSNVLPVLGTTSGSCYLIDRWNS
jgi:hypothetical protein